MGRAFSLGRTRLQQQLSGKHTDVTLEGFIWEAMSISDLLDGGGRELHHGSRLDSRHHRESGSDTEMSSHGSELTEELCR